MDAILASREFGDEDVLDHDDQESTHDHSLEALVSEPAEPFPDAASYSDEVGADVSHAQMVTGPMAASAAESLDARAFTVGDRVFMGAGENPTDRELAAHELTHVAQQRNAALPPTQSSLPVTRSHDPRELEAESAAERPSTGPLEISRAPRGVRTRAARDMESRAKRLAAKNDAELTALRASLTAKLAGNLSTEARLDVSQERDAVEWVEYTRRLERGEADNAHDEASELAAAQSAGKGAGVASTDIEARVRLEGAYRQGGASGGLMARARMGMRGSEDQRRAAFEQSPAIEKEAEAFRNAFREQARHTAVGLLDTSTDEINAALMAYGFVGGSHRLFFAAEEYNKEPDSLGRLVTEWRSLSDAPERAAQTKKGDKEQIKLAKVVGELRLLKADVDRLEAEEKGFTEADWAARDVVDPARSSVAAKAKLADAWLQAETDHPILLAYRHPKYGPDVDRVESLDAPGAGMEESILRQAIPKLGNILRTRVALRTHQLNPLRLAPVVELTKQHMAVPPGSSRAAVVNELYQEASKESVADTVLSAVSIALSVLSFVPGVGLPAKVLAEATSLAIELRAQVNEYKEWKVAGGINNTSLDIARSVSLQSPHMRPLYLRLAVLGASAGSLVQLARLSTQLKNLRATDGAADDVLHEIDALGERHGVKNLAREVEEVGAVRGAKVYPPKTFEKEGITRVSKLNVDRVKDGLKRVRGRAFVAGGRLEIDASKATVEGGDGILRIPGAHGDTVVDVEIRFRGELSAPGPHGADSGPARFTLDKSKTGWAARIEVADSVDPKDIEFIVGHELDEIAELTRRFPGGKPPEGFGDELTAGVMRSGAKTSQSTAHDLATAREIIAQDATHKKLIKEGSSLASVRAQSLEEAMKAAGLDEVSELDAKLRLLKQEGAPDDLIDRVRRVGTRDVHNRHVAASGKKGTRFTEDLIDHVMWGRGQVDGKFMDRGISGGHFTDQLRQMAYPNSEYVFVEVAQKAAAGSTARKFKQYKWPGNRAAMPQPGSGRFPTDTPFNDAGWITTTMPKTTFDDPAAFLREAEEAWDDWLEGMALSPSGGRKLKSNEFTARTKSGVQVSGFFEPGPDGTPVPTTVYAEASWF